MGGTSGWGGAEEHRVEENTGNTAEQEVESDNKTQEDMTAK